MKDFISKRISANTLHINEIIAGGTDTYEFLQSKGLVVLHDLNDASRYFVFDLTASLTGTRMHAIENLGKFVNVISQFNELRMSHGRLSNVALKLLSSYFNDPADHWIRFVIKRSGEYFDFPVAIIQEEPFIRFTVKTS